MPGRGPPRRPQDRDRVVQPADPEQLARRLRPRLRRLAGDAGMRSEVPPGSAGSRGAAWLPHRADVAAENAVARASKSASRTPQGSKFGCNADPGRLSRVRRRPRPRIRDSRIRWIPWNYSSRGRRATARRDRWPIPENESWTRAAACSPATATPGRALSRSLPRPTLRSRRLPLLPRWQGRTRGRGHPHLWRDVPATRRGRP
jgi:hypothetical protein